MDNAYFVHLRSTSSITENVSLVGQSIITVSHASILPITVQFVMYNFTQFLANAHRAEISSKAAPHVFPNSHAEHVLLTYTYSMPPVNSAAVVTKFTLIARNAIREGVCSARIRPSLMMNDASLAIITNKVVHCAIWRKLNLSVMDAPLGTIRPIRISA